MGDGGSMVLGFTLSWLAIHVTTAFGSASVSPIACLWIVAVPLADTASCIVRRLMEGGSPMTPDLKHLHNLARRSGLTISQSVAAIHLGAFLCGLVGVMGWWRQIEDRWLFAFFAIALAIFIVVTNFAWRRLEGGEVVGQVSRVATAAELSDSDVRGIGH